ncbi:uncharacterized protein LOC121432098 isoform X2 [Lytechinus variegatus]|uniref:uncharacterized protein LOC121432098 isoform X2 n=1 Tax=Lytechinus variegatus TaxID=7654 RepID=UPI001BB2625D|nr:uncharacterized protein LOC121432098 isoform X2 [Lytechinus variegatus]
MASWLKDQITRSGVKTRTQPSRNIFKPGNTTSVIFSKGLLNAPGDNNCFLNSAVQVLWHLDVFRRSFREMSGHACMGKACIFCALKTLFTQLRHSEETVLPPDALRTALASAFKDQLRFQLGCMDDAAECFENILVRIHIHLAHNIKEDLCDAKHCIPHRKFAMTLIEHSVCKCGATSEPFPFTQMVHYVSSTALCAEANKMRQDRRWPNTDHFGVLLRKAGAIGDVRDCPSSCGLKIHIRRILMNCPDVVSIGLIWDSDKPDVEHISDVICNLGTTIQLRELFDDTVDDRAKANSLFLVGIVTYYGRHYTTFFYNTNLRYWVYFDDAVVKQVGHNWSDVVDRCRRGHFQPLLLLYAYPDGKAVSTATAPKFTTMLKGYDKDDKENGPLVHPNKPEESLLHKVLAEPEERIPIHHYHGNSNSSTMSGQSASSNDSQNTLVYKPVGTVPEFQASSETQPPPRVDSGRDVRRNEAVWEINDDGSVANATRASWIPNSVVEIGHEALNYVPMKKPGEGSYAISQFALQGHDDHMDKGNSSKTMPRSQNKPERPSSAKDSSYGQRIQVPMSPQQSKRPSSAQSKISRQSVRQVSSSVVSTSESVPQRTDMASQNGAKYNARTGMITDNKEAQSPQHVPQPSLTFEPFGNFATEVECEPVAQVNERLNVKPLQEFGVRQRPQDTRTNQTNVLNSNQQNPKTNVVRQGSWSSGTSGQYSGDSFQRPSSSENNQSVQRTSSLSIKPLERYQASHSSNPDLKSDANDLQGLNSNSSYNSSNNGQFPKYSSVPDLQRQSPQDDRTGKHYSSSDLLAGSRSIKRSPSLDQPVSPGGILDAAIRNHEPAVTQNHQQTDGRHIPLMRSSSVTRNSDEKQARAKLNIQNGFLTLPGKKRANQFRASNKQSLVSGGSSGMGYNPGQQRDAMYHQPNAEVRSHSTPHNEGLTMRQTPEVHVSKGLDIDSIASRDSGYRSRDRSSASSGSVYSLDGHSSDTAPSSGIAPTSSDKDSSKYGHVHQSYEKSPQPSTDPTRNRGDAQRSKTPTAQLGQHFAPAADKSESGTPLQLQRTEDVVVDLMKGVEEQLGSSIKAEEGGDLAIALGLCTAAASTLKIALRLDGLNEQTKLFLQTKYNTTVLKSRGLHRRLTLLRRSQEDKNTVNTPPPPPQPDYPRAQPIQRRDSREDMRRQEQESMKQIELLKKRVEDLSQAQDTSRLYGQKSSTEQTDSSRIGYQPQQYRSVPSSPSLQRNRPSGNQNMQYGSATSTASGSSVGHGHGRINQDPSSGQGRVPQGHGASQGSSVGSSGHHVASASPSIHKDWTQSQIGYPSGYATVGRSATPLGFSSTTRQAETGGTRYRSQTPTPYLGSAKPSTGYSEHHLNTAGNRNNNAINQQTGRGYQNTPSEVQPRIHNQDWVRREQPRPETTGLGKPMMSDTTTFIKYNSAIPQQGSMRGTSTYLKHRMGDNLIDLS